MQDIWYCIVLGSELGPMPWESLVELAQKGVLKPQHDVRRGTGGVCVEAGRIPELARHLAPAQPRDDDHQPPGDGPPALQERAPAHAELDQYDEFDVATLEKEWATATLEPPPPPTLLAPNRSADDFRPLRKHADLETHSDAVEQDAVETAEPSTPRTPRTAPAARVATAPTEPSTLRKAPTAVAPPLVASPLAAPAVKPTKPAKAAKPKKEKPAKRAAPPKAPRRRRSSADVGKLAKAVVGLAVVCALAAGGYFGWQSFGRGQRVDTTGRPAVSSVDRLRDELNFGRKKLHEGQYSGDLNLQFQARLKAVRPVVDSMPPGSLAESLKSALTLLGEMSTLAVARGADEDRLYLERDTKLKALLDEARRQLVKAP